MGSVGARALLILAMPLLTRLYTPADFGVLSVFASLFSPLLILVTLRYEQAIVLPETDEEAADVLRVSLVTVLLVTTLVSLLVWVGFDTFISLYPAISAIEAYKWLLPCGLLGGGVYATYYQWALRKNALKEISLSRLYQACGMLAAKFGWLLVARSPTGLVLGYTIGQFAGATFLVRSSLRSHARIPRGWNRRRLLATMRAYSKFPLITAPGTFLGALGLQLPPLALVAMYSTDMVGKYAITVQILSIPQAMVGMAIGHLFVRDFAEKIHQDPAWLRPAFLRFVRNLGAVAGLVIVGGLFAPYYLPLLLGPGWSETGVYAQILAFPFAAQLVGGTTTNLITLGFNSWQAVWHAAFVGSIATVFVVSQLLHLAPVETLMIYSVSTSLMYLSLLALNLHALSVFARAKEIVSGEES